jgi:hypothetical protein
VASGDRWQAAIQYGDLDEGNHLSMNRTLAEVAQRFVFSATEKAVSDVLTRSDHPVPVPDPIQLGFVGPPLDRIHEFTWHRLVSVLEKHPLSPESWDFEVDWAAVASGWAPITVLPMNAPIYPPAIRRKEGLLRVTLYDPNDVLPGSQET